VGEPQDAKLFQLLGLFLSSASNDPSAIHLQAIAEDPETVEELAEYVSGTWAACDRVYADDYTDPSMLAHQATRRDNGDEEDGDTTAHDRSTLAAPLTNRRLLSRLKAYVKIEAGLRRLSDDAFTAGLAAQKHLIRAFFTADANVENGLVELRCDSLGLLQDVQLLLLGFGVKAGVFSDSIENWIAKAPANSAEGEKRAAVDGQSGRHWLRLDAGSLRTFAKYIGFLPGRKATELAVLLGQPNPAASRISELSRSMDSANYDRVATLTPLGRKQVFDLTEPVTHSFIANGLTVHNCSEYMFLDDTACNLASLNVLTFFDSEARRFDVEAYKHGIRLWTIVLEISVLMASFPSEEIAKLSYHFRTLGLGYANLGAMTATRAARSVPPSPPFSPARATPPARSWRVN
jgi:ribonucleoside-diphosphate reductase alpha chain